MYSVFDLTAAQGRVVEIAIVRADRLGRIIDEWHSLIDPGHTEPVEVRGIDPAELRAAPSFADLAGKIGELLRSRAVVAHNLPVRSALLTAEFERLGVAVPVHGLCTMRLARHFLPAASRGLDACRAGAGLSPHRTEAALADARAAAELLAWYVDAAGFPPPWLPVVDEAAETPWPSLPVPLNEGLPRRHARQRPRDFIAWAVDRLPRHRDLGVDSYYEILDRSLMTWSVPPDQLSALHFDYLRELAAVSVDLGMAETGRPDLVRAAILLGLPAEAVEDAFAQARADEPLVLQPGDTVVFTGDLNPRWQNEARAAGLVVDNAVTRRTRLMVTADPDSRTGNAEKARRYQVPIVHPVAYRNILRSVNGRAR